MEEDWKHPYSREVAAFPAVSIRPTLYAHTTKRKKKVLKLIANFFKKVFHKNSVINRVKIVQCVHFDILIPVHTQRCFDAPMQRP